MKKLLLYGIAMLALPLPAAASCGAAFCSVNTSWDAQGAWQEPGGRFDLRYEYVKQDQPMAGGRKVAFGTLRRHHDEMVTRNHNLVAGVDYTLNADWGINALLPVVHRGHAHIHNHGGAQLLDTWNFTELGDAKVVARRRLDGSEPGQHSGRGWGVLFGLKLPTGPTNVRNSNAELAERTLQPGTGTTDALLGAYYMRHGDGGFSWFVQPMVQVPLYKYQEFKPGNRFTLDVGGRYEAGERLSLLLQVNALHRSRDSGRLAEPADSGGSSVFLSPGLSYALSREWQVYGFVQLPLHQYVNGVQLTAQRALAVGLGARF